MRELIYFLAALVVAAFLFPASSEAGCLGHRVHRTACAPVACQACAPAKPIPPLPSACALPHNAAVVPGCAACSQPAAVVGKARCAVRKVAGLALRLPRAALKALRIRGR